MRIRPLDIPGLKASRNDALGAYPAAGAGRPRPRAAGLGKMLLAPPPRRSLGLDMNYESSASLESSGIGAAGTAAEPRREGGSSAAAAAAARLSKGQHHGFGFHSILLKMSGLELVKHADWLQFGELLSVPKEALDKERWLHLLAAYDPDGSGEIPVSEVVTDALQPVAVELITCLARTVHTLSNRYGRVSVGSQMQLGLGLRVVGLYAVAPLMRCACPFICLSVSGSTSSSQSTSSRREVRLVAARRPRPHTNGGWMAGESGDGDGWRRGEAWPLGVGSLGRASWRSALQRGRGAQGWGRGCVPGRRRRPRKYGSAL